MAMSGMADEDYEALRLANIAANQLLLESLGLAKQAKIPVKRSPGPKHLPPPREPSARLRKLEAVGRISRSHRSSAKELGKRRAGRASSAADSESDDGDAMSIDSDWDWKRSAGRMRSFIADSEDDDDVAGRAYDRQTSRLYRAEPLRKAARLGVRKYDPKRFGHIPGVPVGSWWETRMVSATIFSALAIAEAASCRAAMRLFRRFSKLTGKVSRLAGVLHGCCARAARGWHQWQP